ncbi:MAG TPA: TIGR03943 family protein [Actinomycetota bacterium]|nr:TIGR03943 family protein [Actinomycetota bacterium]
MSRTWSPLRTATGAVLAAWAGLFWFLLLTGRSPLYLSDRTAWVVPLGAVVLSVAAAGRLATARSEATEPLPRRTAWWLGLIVMPVVLVLALPPAALGSYAASRRSAVAAGVVPAQGLSSGPVTLVHVAAAMWSPDARRQLVARAGTSVSFVGFVSRRAGMPTDEFVITRFLVSCCVADALSVQVRVVGAPPGRFAQDQWVRVTGSVYPLGREVLVEASEVEAVPRPDRPYLNV